MTTPWLTKNLALGTLDTYRQRLEQVLTRLTALEFLDKIGPTRFAAVWQASMVNPAVAFPMVRGLAAQEVLMAEAFPSLYQLEQAGLLPAGTAIEIWS